LRQWRQAHAIMLDAGAGEADQLASLMSTSPVPSAYPG
jgi:hypothetical protein